MNALLYLIGACGVVPSYPATLLCILLHDLCFFPIAISPVAEGVLRLDAIVQSPAPDTHL